MHFTVLEQVNLSETPSHVIKAVALEKTGINKEQRKVRSMEINTTQTTQVCDSQ